MDHHSDTNDANSINGADFISAFSSQLDHDVTMKRRSFSHEYHGRNEAACASNVQDDCDEVRSTSSASQSQLLNHPSHNSMLQVTSMENSSMSGHQRQKFRETKSVSGSARQRRRTQGDMLVMGAVESHAQHFHTVNRERANTCPQHQFHHHYDLVETEGTQEEAEIFPGQDEESGGVGRDDFRLHGSDRNESRSQSLPSSAAVSFPEYQAAQTSVASSPRRRAASASSIISPLQPTPATATTTTAMPFSLLYARTTTTASSTTNFMSSYTITTVKHTLLKLFMLISVYQLLSYTYNTGLSPELIEMNYGIEEYWYGGRLWSNRLSASRIVGSSGISFNDDYDGGTTGEEEEGGQEEEEDESIVGFVASVLSEKFGFLNEGGEGEGIFDDEGELQHDEVVAAASVDGGDSANVSAFKVDTTTLEKKSDETTATPIIDGNNNKVTKRRPAMAHVISISDARRPAYLPRSSSRRMKTKDSHWTLSRIAGALIWVGLMIPILEVGIRQVSRRYRLGSLLRRRMRMVRGAFRRGSSENVHIL